MLKPFEALTRSRLSSLSAGFALALLAACGTTPTAVGVTGGDEDSSADGSGDGSSFGDGSGEAGSGDVGADVDPDGTTDGSGLPDPGCGNGVWESTEACDDGNLVAGDGCEPDCTISAGSPCALCTSSAECSAPTSICAQLSRPAFCLAPCDAAGGCAAGFTCEAVPLAGDFMPMPPLVCVPDDRCVRFCEDPDNDGICAPDDICPAGDDRVDSNGNGIPDACDGPVGGEVCLNGLDDDRNGLIDCADPICFGLPECTGIFENCVNGLDDDGNGLVDCADPFCFGLPDCGPAAERCNDFVDNDLDGLVDCLDTDCAGDRSCLLVEICDDGFDNNRDGFVDCSDPTCSGTAGCVGTEICNDLLDNDRDGLTDCADRDCALQPGCVVLAEVCANGLDDDRNGLVDCLDPACVGTPLCAPSTEVCNDLVDNDGDRRIDCGDTDCATDPACPTGPQSCVSPTVITDFGVSTGATLPGTSSAAGSCVDSSGTEAVFAFTPPTSGTVCMRTRGSSFNTLLYARSSCANAASEITCNDNGRNQQSEISFSAVAGQTYFIFVDGVSGANGSYVLAVTEGTCPPLGLENCTDGIDNDSDFFADCADTDCFSTSSCISSAEVCTDRVDNDRDGAVDCADTDCVANAACLPPGAEVCNDLFDNDRDGATDCADSDCTTNPLCIRPPETNCTNRLDDDGDGAIDCFDTNCIGSVSCIVFELCADGIDNDSDTLVDCADNECTGAPNCVTVPQTCASPNVATTYGRYSGLTSGLLNENVPSCMRSTAPESVWRFTPPETGLICVTTAGSTYDTVLFARNSCGGTATDLACNDDTGGLTSQVQVAVTAGVDVFLMVDGFAALGGSYRLNITGGACGSGVGETACTDRVDNDRDGRTDCADSDCAGNVACIVPATETNCTDRIDNDGDGAVDCADSNCTGTAACAVPSSETSCTDVVDNDRDGAIDCADPDCDADPACALPANELDCGDGLDDDGDGAIDCADTDCLASTLCVPPVGTCDAPLTLNPFGANAGNLAEGANVAAGSCGGLDGNEQVWGLDLAFPLPLDVAACVTVRSDAFSPVLYYGTSTCGAVGSELACNPSADGLSASLAVTVGPGDTLSLFVDSLDGGAGAYDLSVNIGACP
jgi:hypothetical protein